MPPAAEFTEPGLRFLAAWAWREWAQSQTAAAEVLAATAGLIRGGEVARLGEPAQAAVFPSAFLTLFARVQQRWLDAKSREKFDESRPLLAWRSPSAGGAQFTEHQWLERIRERFGVRGTAKLNGVRFSAGLAEGCATQAQTDGWLLRLDPEAAVNEDWLWLRIARELYLQPHRAWWGRLPGLLTALARQAWELQLLQGLNPRARQNLRSAFAPALPLAGAYAQCESLGVWESLPGLLSRVSTPSNGETPSGAAHDLALWRELEIVPQQAVMGLLFYSQFGLGDALEEYTQRKWIYHPQQVAATLERRLADVVPVTVDIVPALECPQDCPVCSNVDWRKNYTDAGWINTAPGERLMPEATLMSLIENIAAAGSQAIVFTGGGEPLVNPHTIRGAQRARSLGLEVGLYTNGILLSPSKIDALLDCGLTFIRYSMNAVTPAGHARAGGYAPEKKLGGRVVESVRYLAAQNQSLGRPCTVGLSFIVNPGNVDELGELAQWLRSLEDDPATRGGIAYLAVRPSLVHRGYLGGEQFDPEIFAAARRRVAEQVEPLLRDTGIKVIEITSRFESVHDTAKPFRQCTSTPWFGAAGPDGGLYLCAESFYGHASIRLGNLAETPLSEIFHGEAARRVIAGIDFRACPPVCKMHELNKYFEPLLQLNQADRDWVKDWLLTLAQTTTPPPHVNFI